MNLSSQIYTTLTGLIPELQNVAPFTRIDLGSKGLADVHLVVFESTQEIVQFIISQHVREQGKLIANPCFEIAVHFQKKMANVLSYMDGYRFFDIKSSQTRITAAIQSEAESAFLAWLHNLQCC